MSDIIDWFDERVTEINEYLGLIEGIEVALRSGIPRLGESSFAVTTQQQKILNSCVYLQLYNIIEATMTNCLNEISRGTMQSSRWLPSDLTHEFRKEWIKSVARTNVQMGADKRLEDAIRFCEYLVNSTPISEFEIEKGGGGNWSDKNIRKIAERIGITFHISRSVESSIKMKIRDDLGSMALIVELRNRLAHGRSSFVDCGQDDTIDDLRRLTQSVTNYLREVIKNFKKFIDNYEYILPEKRPSTNTPSEV